jgi:MFS family permease
MPGSEAVLAVPPGRLGRVRQLLALERNTLAVVGAMFLMALGENLWRRFLPKYLEALGAPILAIGAYGSVEDALDGLYQYPGGWASDRYGRRHALLLFVALAAVGYVVIAAAPAWPVVFVGLLLIMCWTSMASPTLFAVVGDALPAGRRSVGFSVQAILRRLPILVAPVLGGTLIAMVGIRAGVRAGLMASVALALVTLAVVRRMRLDRPAAPPPGDIRSVWRSLPAPLRRLLVSDICIRTCDAMVDVFLVLYAVNVVRISAPAFGGLIGVQMATVILCSLPAAYLADRVGRKPFVIATFVAFASFPLAVVAAHSLAGLVAAFVVGGLREIGEPARKAMIVDFAEPHLRARSVGLYYLVRSMAVTPAALVGALLWRGSPALPFFVAAGAGFLGTALFVWGEGVMAHEATG